MTKANKSSNMTDIAEFMDKMKIVEKRYEALSPLINGGRIFDLKCSEKSKKILVGKKYKISKLKEYAKKDDCVVSEDIFNDLLENNLICLDRGFPESFLYFGSYVISEHGKRYFK